MEKKSFLSYLFGGKKKNDVSKECIKYEPESVCCCDGEAKAEESCCCHGVKAKDVRVLGPGCAKCISTFKVVEKVIKERGLDITLTEVTDIEQMMSYNIMQTPAVVVDGKVVIKGHVPSEDEVKKALGL